MLVIASSYADHTLPKGLACFLEHKVRSYGGCFMVGVHKAEKDPSLFWDSESAFFPLKSMTRLPSVPHNTEKTGGQGLQHVAAARRSHPLTLCKRSDLRGIFFAKTRCCRTPQLFYRSQPWRGYLWRWSLDGVTSGSSKSKPGRAEEALAGSSWGLLGLLN